MKAKKISKTKPCNDNRSSSVFEIALVKIILH